MRERALTPVFRQQQKKSTDKMLCGNLEMWMILKNDCITATFNLLVKLQHCFQDSDNTVEIAAAKRYIS